MPEPTTTTFALLGLLAVRPWNSYELTQQARRSLRYVWPRSEANLYAEQKRLVSLGYATTSKERVGRRQRTRYQITPAGRTALRRWLGTDPEPPRFEVEGVLRLLFAEHGSLEDLRSSLRSTAAQARADLDDGVAMAEDYLETGGPFPERLQLISLASVWFAESLALLERVCEDTLEEIEGWDDVAGPADTSEAMVRFRRLRDRHRREPQTETKASS